MLTRYLTIRLKTNKRRNYYRPAEFVVLVSINRGKHSKNVYKQCGFYQDKEIDEE
jgi:hypothetical protein